jgi:hypothetical protein
MKMNYRKTHWLILLLGIALVAGASSRTQPVTRGQVPRKAPAKWPPKAAEPIVRLLESGTEPRKVLRVQPKAGDKQIVAFTMKMAMDPALVTNLPPIT